MQDMITNIEAEKVWVKPQINIISVNNDTLAAGGTTGDGGGGSQPLS